MAEFRWKKKHVSEINKLNRIKKSTNYIFNAIFVIGSALCIIPFLFVIIISFTSEEAIKLNGYQFIPESLSLNAYKFLWGEREVIISAFFISVLVTVIGTVLGLILTATMGYVLSLPNYKLKGFFTMIVFIPMIFRGGMVANYVVVANILGLQNSIWALILPLVVSSFNVVICKTFFKLNIPISIIESAKIDGASQLNIFTKIVVPISKPLMATIGLFLSFGYWNDWYQSSLYINDSKLYSLQALLNSIQKSVEYLANDPTAGVSIQQYINSMPTESVRMAIAVVVVLPIACAYPFFQKYFISGLTLGAVKG